MAPEINPYRISVPDASIKLLKDKLSSSVFFDEVDFSDSWDYGAPLSDVKRLAAYWADGFDWRAQEANINLLPQFTTKVNIEKFGELEMHFVHQKSSNPNSIPLLFCHGWPGSFLEVQKILPLLTAPDKGPSFHVVAPSLPNFGFSERVSKPGFSVPQCAEAMHKVMLNLGYAKYVTQGGDWGFWITRLMGIRFPDHCIASHLNSVNAPPPDPIENSIEAAKNAVSTYTEQEQAGLQRTEWFKQEGFGYNLEQSTRPSTIGFALADSPVALLAWIYEKLHDWTDSYPWTDDEILTWISLYQFSRAGPAASVRIYYETKHNEWELVKTAQKYVPDVKLGLSYFPKDLEVPPASWGRLLGPVVFERRHEDGGHFAAHERPERLAEDLKEMFGPSGGANAITQLFAS